MVGSTRWPFSVLRHRIARRDESSAAASNPIRYEFVGLRKWTFRIKAKGRVDFQFFDKYGTQHQDFQKELSQRYVQKERNLKVFYQERGLICQCKVSQLFRQPFYVTFVPPLPMATFSSVFFFRQLFEIVVDSNFCRVQFTGTLNLFSQDPEITSSRPYQGTHRPNNFAQGKKPKDLKKTQSSPLATRRLLLT